MKAEILRRDIITPVLEYADDVIPYSDDAVELLLLTAAQETHLGQFIHQEGTGPALGIYQEEPHTHDDIWVTTIGKNNALREVVLDLATARYTNGVPASELEGNLYYATIHARIFYYRIAEALPSRTDLNAMAAYYKKYWNTERGAATIPQVIDNYHRYVA